MIADLFAVSRPLSWINTAFPFAVAYLLNSGDVDARLIIGTFFFLIPYNLAMYGINDVFDYASDVANPRKGGVEGALLDPRRHRGVLIAAALLCVPFVVALVILGTPVSWAALSISLFAVVAYSAPPLRFKEIPVLDSVTSSVHFCSPAFYGILLGGGAIDQGSGAILLAFFLWGMASHAFGAVQDILPDRAGGIASIATVLGAGRTVRTAIMLWAGAAVIVLTAGWPASLAALLAVPYFCASAPFARISDAHSGAARRGWRHFLWINYLCGFLVTLLVILYAVT